MGTPAVRGSWYLDQFSPSRENDTRDSAIVHANPRNYGALAREVRMRRTVSAVWSQMANFLVSNDARVQHGSFLGECVLLPVVLELLTRRLREWKV